MYKRQPIFVFIFIKVFIRNPINFDYFSVNTKPFFRINEMLDYVFNNFNVGMGQTYIPVSYTHLDAYKRQVINIVIAGINSFCGKRLQK